MAWGKPFRRAALPSALIGDLSRYSVINDPASSRVLNIVDRSVFVDAPFRVGGDSGVLLCHASADNPRLQPESNTRSFTLLSHKV